MQNYSVTMKLIYREYTSVAFGKGQVVVSAYELEDEPWGGLLVTDRDGAKTVTWTDRNGPILQRQAIAIFDATELVSGEEKHT